MSAVAPEKPCWATSDARRPGEGRDPASFSRYPKYKDSGVEWLGEVPAHWEVARIKTSVASCRNGIWGSEESGSDDDIPCVRVADFDRNRLVVDQVPPTIRSVSIREREGRLLRSGDLLLEKSGGGEGQPVGCVVLYGCDAPAVCSNFVARMELRAGMIPSFWRYVHAAAYSARLTTRSINQTSGIQNFDQDRYFNERAAFPSLEEQSVIAAFLDRETAKIDALIAEQGKLIALLREKRQALISHAVTKGLDPNAPMKDSGVEWLSQVPAHWAVTRCGRFVSILSGFAFPSSGFDHDGNGTRLLRGINVGVGTLRWDGVVYWRREPQDGLDDYQMKAGDIVIGMDRPLISEGIRVAKLTSSDIPSLLLQRVASLRTSARLNGDFFAYLLTTPMFIAHFSPNTTGVSVPHISPEQIASFVIPVPSLSEQKEIVSRLADRASQLDILMVEVERNISLLKERRSALISAAVTGKIDVRHAA